MNDSLEARLAAMPGIEADLTPYAEWLVTRRGANPCCVRELIKRRGCSGDCQQAESDDYHFHGEGSPTPESLIVFKWPRGQFVCECGLIWGQFQFVHRPLVSDFDEETERVRLMPV